MRVATYKGLALRLFIFGLQPADFAFVLLAALMAWGTTFSPAFTAVCFFGGYFLARKGKHADMETRKILIRFLITPPRIAVKSGDIPGYRLCLK